MPSVRRLTAILAADVAGYSRLMGADEEGTHRRFRGHLQELVHPKIAEHRGRVVKNTGDGLLAEFPSVVDAVRCGVELQRGMIERNAVIPVDQRIELRVGINLGDVIVEGEDIFGDGVNIAARLEGLAEPGGICVSRVVRDQVRDKLDFAFEDIGEQQVKNIARPVRVYRVRDTGTAAKSPSVPTLPLPDKPSIAVLPFANLSGDPEQEYFADGMVEEIITALSRIRWLFVIARNSSFTYKGQFDDASAKLLASLEQLPAFALTYCFLASCYAHMGRHDEARDIVERLRAITPVVVPSTTPYRNPEHQELFLSGLRLAMGEAI